MIDEKARPLLDKLLSSKKYADLCPDTVTRIFEDCLLRYKKPKDADKAAREKLHGMTGAFVLPDSTAADSLEALLHAHASTRERLPLSAMDALWENIESAIGTPDTILDLACGLNPLYLHHRYPDASIVGADISRWCVDRINEAGMEGLWIDLLTENTIPTSQFDAVLLLKILPLLERQQVGSSEKLMASLNAKHIIVSIPTKSLSGRNVGMSKHYGDWMAAHPPVNRSLTHTFETENELFYIWTENKDA
ncbi:MAG: 16S rRNA (guanine(1405)-N(7))-methyltransferase RmtD [Clostridia bacterium]|nr:16S rRNA (guanine(1405)-N(7))-methyltransferase RmtD [Clostridia bacterium]